MRSTIPKIFNYGAMAFMAGLLVLSMTLSKPSLGEGGTPKIQILPREVTSQPFDFSFTIELQPDINALSSFSVLVNGADVTFSLIIAALKTPGLVSFPDSATLKLALPGISLPEGTFKIDVNATSSSGEKASDSVTYTIGVPPPTTPPPALISYARNVKPIFDKNCAIPGCHSGRNPQAGMDLSTPFAPGVGAVGVSSQEVPTLLRIKPGDPEGSYLVHKIQGTQAQVGGFGGRMPLTGPPFLSDEEIQLIRKWIGQGAQNN